MAAILSPLLEICATAACSSFSYSSGLQMFLAGALLSCSPLLIFFHKSRSCCCTVFVGFTALYCSESNAIDSGARYCITFVFVSRAKGTRLVISTGGPHSSSTSSDPSNSISRISHVKIIRCHVENERIEHLPWHGLGYIASGWQLDSEQRRRKRCPNSIIVLSFPLPKLAPPTPSFLSLSLHSVLFSICGACDQPVVWSMWAADKSESNVTFPLLFLSNTSFFSHLSSLWTPKNITPTPRFLDTHRSPTPFFELPSSSLSL